MFAALLLPHFRLQAALRLRHEWHGEPTVIVDDEAGLVVEASEAAAAHGIHPEMPGVQALARCPELKLLSSEPRQERSVQAVLTEVAISLSPTVEETAPGLCTLDLRAARGVRWAEWGKPVIDQLAALGLRGQVGVAPNPDLAFLAARRAQPYLFVQSPPAFLAQIAVAEIDPPPHLLALLREWGVHTLGQLTSLPRGDLADRLGPDGDRLWQRAAGQTQRLLRLIRPIAEYAETFDFEREIETVEPLFFMLRRFLDQLALRLTNAGRVAAKMTLILPLEDGSTHERLFTIPAPTAAVEVLFRILETHLGGLKLERRPVGLRLLIEPVKPGQDQLRLFESPLRDANRFGETLARLAALVGHENVGVVEVEDTHRADRFRVVEPRFHELRADVAAGEDFTTGLPLRRFRPPLRAQVQLKRHAPAYIVSDSAHGRVAEALGPYRTSGGWWDAERWATEEWDVELAGGGLYRISRQENTWSVEGCYDAELR